MATIEELLSMALGAGQAQVAKDDPYLGLQKTGMDIGNLFQQATTNPKLMEGNGTRDAILGAAISGLFGGAMGGLSQNYQTDRTSKYNDLLMRSMGGEDVSGNTDVTPALAKQAQTASNLFKVNQKFTEADDLRKLIFDVKKSGLTSEATERGKLNAYEPVGVEGGGSGGVNVLNPRSQEVNKIAKTARDELKTNPVAQGFADLKPNFDTMIKTYEFNDKPATLAFVSSFARLLDPGSVVREGEIKNAENTQSFLNQMGYSLSSLVDGSQSLSPQTKQEMARAASAKYNQFGTDFTSAIDRQKKLVTQLGGDPSQVFGGVDYVPFDFDTWSTNATQSTLAQQKQESPIVQNKQVQLQGILEQMKQPGISSQDKARLTAQARAITGGQ